MDTNTPGMSAEEYQDRMATCGVPPLKLGEIAGAMKRNLDQADPQNPCTVMGDSPRQGSIFNELAAYIVNNYSPDQPAQKSHASGPGNEPDPLDPEFTPQTGPRPG